MGGKNIHAEAFDEGTLDKLSIFEGYLQSWLPVFIHAQGILEITIVDFFAGSGSDARGVPGSPIRIIDSINKYSDAIRATNTKIDVILNELDSAKFQTLIDSVSSKDGSSIRALKTENRTFKELFDELKVSLRNVRSFLFLDQNGVKEVSEQVFRDLCAMPMAECMFFVSSSFARRFIGEPEFRKHLGWMGDDPFKGVSPGNIHRAIISKYRELIPDRDDIFLIPFSIKKGKNIYGLIFMCRHLRAADKFLEVVWRANDQNGEANFDIDDEESLIQGDLFGTRLKKIEQFEEKIRTEFLERTTLSNRDLYEFTIKSGFLPKHASGALKKLRDEGFLATFGHTYIGYEQCFNDKKLVHFKVK